MDRAAAWLAAGMLLLCSVLVPRAVYAWPDPDPYPMVRLVTGEEGGSGSWQAGVYQGERWPDRIAGRTATRLDAPPQLDIVQAQRWRVAFPSAKPRLAQLYKVPREIAEIYGAKYTIIYKDWVFSWR